MSGGKSRALKISVSLAASVASGRLVSLPQRCAAWLLVCLRRDIQLSSFTSTHSKLFDSRQHGLTFPLLRCHQSATALGATEDDVLRTASSTLVGCVRRRGDTTSPANKFRESLSRYGVHGGDSASGEKWRACGKVDAGRIIHRQSLNPVLPTTYCSPCTVQSRCLCPQTTISFVRRHHRDR